ncbi:hypothetical protein Tco_1406213 [Tanacetum coccineum]
MNDRSGKANSAKDVKDFKLTEYVNALLEQNEHFKAENEKDQLKSKVSCVTMNSVKPKVLAPGMYAINVVPIAPRLKNNMNAHVDYINHLKERVGAVCEIVEEARIAKPIDNALDFACRYIKLSQELLEPTRKKFTLGKHTGGYQWRPTGKLFPLKEQCPLTRILMTCHTECPLVSGLRLSKTYDGESLKAQEFCKEGQFCDSDLEATFRKHSCFVQNIEGMDLLKGINEQLACRRSLKLHAKNNSDHVFLENVALLSQVANGCITSFARMEQVIISAPDQECLVMETDKDEISAKLTTADENMSGETGLGNTLTDSTTSKKRKRNQRAKKTAMVNVLSAKVDEVVSGETVLVSGETVPDKSVTDKTTPEKKKTEVAGNVLSTQVHGDVSGKAVLRKTRTINTTLMTYTKVTEILGLLRILSRQGTHSGHY